MIVSCWWLLQILWKATNTEVSINILSYLHNFCRSQGVKSAQNWPKICLFFFQISWKIALWKNVNSAKILQCLHFLHIYRNSTKSTFSEDGKSFGPHLQRLGSQRPKKWTRITKIGYANIYRPHVEIKESTSQQMDKICTKTGYVNTFAPRNPSRHTQITFFF